MSASSRLDSGLLRNRKETVPCLTTPAAYLSTGNGGDSPVRPEFPPIVPKKLGDVVKLEMFNDKSSEEIR